MVSQLGDICDPRRAKSVVYPLREILFIALCAMLSGADAFTEFQAYGKTQRSWLGKHLDLENGIPSHDTFRTVFGLIDPGEFNRFFMRWTRGLCKLDGGDVIAIDGKSLRGSSKEQAVHLVNAWASGNNLILGQMKTDKKSNEITAIPQLLKQLTVKGSIITIDAMGTQKTIAREIDDAEGSYVLCLKNNHPKLFKQVADFMEDSREAKAMDYYQVTEKDHGRNQTWRHWISGQTEWLSESSQWAGLCSLGKVERIREVKGIKSKPEIHYYLCSIEPDAHLLAHCVRNHWGVENKAHWILDVNFNEDACQVRNQAAASNLSMLRKMAINLFRTDTSNESLRLKRKLAGWNTGFLEQILNLTRA